MTEERTAKTRNTSFKNEETPLARRMKIALEVAKMSQVELARKTGIPISTVNSWCASKATTMRRSAAIAAGSCLKVSPTWLATGEGLMVDEAKDVPISTGYIGNSPSLALVRIRGANIVCSAGGGVENFDISDNAELECCMGKEFFIRNRVDFMDCRMMEVRGDSMSPTIEDGDEIMVNCRGILSGIQERIIQGKIYVFSLRGEIYIKRLRMTPYAITASSDNKDYEDFTIDKDNEDSFKLIGRVLRRVTDNL